MEGSKTFFSSKFPWAHIGVSMNSVDNLSMYPQKGSPAMIYTVYMYSSLPMNVPIQNGKSGTLIIGAVMLMNQFGKKGVMRRNKM